MTATPLVSVCMVTYMHERYIAAAIEGVLAQACDFPFELVIGDDCSTDATGRIVAEYARRHPDLIRTVSSTSNVGPYANEWRCVLACRGDYIAFCEGDDYWSDPSKLTRQIRLMQADPGIVMSCHGVKLCTESGDGPVDAGTHRITFRSRLLAPAEVVLGDGAMVPTCSVVIRSDVVRKRPTWWRQAPIGDYPMVLRATLAGKLAYLDRVMGVYRVNLPGSWTHRHRRQAVQRGRFADGVREMLHGFLHDAGGASRKEVREVISKYYFDAIVRTDGTREEKRALFARARAELTPADAGVAWLALAFGANLGWMRTPFKRAGAAILRRRHDRLQPPIADGGA